MNISLILDWTEKVRRRCLIGNAVNGRHGREEEETEEEKEMVVEELGATAVERKTEAMEEEKECEWILREWCL